MSRSENSKRTQRLASAIYLITSFFAEKEPLKWDLRRTASGLVSACVEEGGLGQSDKVYPRTLLLARELAALLSVGQQAGLVSEMNYRLTNTELERFSSAVETNGQSLDSLLAPGPESALATEPLIKDKTPILAPPPPPERVSTGLPEGLLPATPSYASPASRPVEKLKGFGAVAVKKNSRQSAIISLLKRKKEIMIKDVSPLIDGVSEKTIQRELLSMVKAGILKKAGEKRWSRYSLAN